MWANGHVFTLIDLVLRSVTQCLSGVTLINIGGSARERHYCGQLLRHAHHK
jgi:hypothetical protein